MKTKRIGGLIVQLIFWWTLILLALTPSYQNDFETFSTIVRVAGVLSFGYLFKKIGQIFWAQQPTPKEPRILSFLSRNLTEQIRSLNTGDQTKITISNVLSGEINVIVLNCTRTLSGVSFSTDEGHQGVLPFLNFPQLIEVNFLFYEDKKYNLSLNCS